MVPGSSQLKALPPPPSGVSLDAVDGDITVTANLFHNKHTLLPAGSLGDLLVKPDSALAYGTDSGNQEYPDSCDMSVPELWDGKGWTGCTHGGLLYEPGVGSQVVSWVSQWIGSNGLLAPVTSSVPLHVCPTENVNDIATPTLPASVKVNGRCPPGYQWRWTATQRAKSARSFPACGLVGASSAPTAVP
jgi:hypothetical protein